ncbi:MAG: polyprenyl synthetase family protein [Myxococcota bacterium]|nr:polyprenyl synthetase family protein [Myxococcota bacterium]
MSEAAAADLVREVLDDYGRATRGALAHYLRPREPRRHLYSLVADYPQRGGRMLRPSLCIATARVFGASVEEAVQSAAAIELLHNAFLVHDDVEDESDERRGKPTLHALHGVPLSINVGDALTLLGFEALIDNRQRLGMLLTMRVLEESVRMARESVEGQAIELGWRRDNAVHLEESDYLEMILKKTCWYTVIFPSRAGALIGSRDTYGLDRLVRFGFFLGAAFQIQDDLLNLAGDPVRYGKELCGDLWEGKRTLILIHLLGSADAAERERIREILGASRSRRTVEDVEWLRGRIDAHGSIDYARQQAHALAGAAQHECALLYADRPESRDRRFIEALPRWVLERA